MKKYIIITPTINNMGGAQMYVRNKVLYCREEGWETLVIAGQGDNILIPELMEFKNSFYELNFHTEGVVTVQCDLCLDDMEQSIDTENKLVVKFGEDYSEEDDLVTVAEDEGILDVSK